MEVTKVIVNWKSPNEKVKAEVTIVLDDAIMIHGLTVIGGRKGLYVSYPYNRKEHRGDRFIYKDIIHPCTTDLSEKISDAVLTAYKNSKATSR